MKNTSERGSILLSLISVGLVIGALYFIKAPDGVSYFDKIVKMTEDAKQGLHDKVEDTRAKAQAHENAVQAEVDRQP